MKNAQPLFDITTHYRIKLQGRVDVDWLQSFDRTAEINVDKTGQTEAITVLNIHTDQAGVVGLVRRLHELRITILQFQIISDGGKAAEAGEQL